VTTKDAAENLAPAGEKWRGLIRALAWLFAFSIFCAAWFYLLALVPPSRANFSNGMGRMLAAFAPPLLVTVIAWVAIRRFSTPTSEAALPSTISLPTSPVEAVPPECFRVGAWSVVSPFGTASETVDGAKARKKLFQPDQAIRRPDNQPVHAASVKKLPLERFGFRSDIRGRAPRVQTMLTMILDDLFNQQPDPNMCRDHPSTVYWLRPESLTASGQSDVLFEAAWKRSAWRDAKLDLRVVAANDGTAYGVLSALQNNMDQSIAPYLMMLAADSLLDSRELEAALALDQVFSDRAPNGFIPSEGAGGILLLNPKNCPGKYWSHAATLGPVISTLRQDSGGAKPDLMSLRTSVESAIAAMGCSVNEIAMIFSDSDHRVKGNLEVITMMTQILPHLDPLEHRISPMEYAGFFGAATDLIHLALAMENSASDEHAACALTMTQHHTCAVLIRPPHA
jgi:hypothetical protein